MKLSYSKSFCLLLVTALAIFFSANAFADNNTSSESSKAKGQQNAQELQSTTNTQDKDSKAAKSFFENATYEEFEPQSEEALFEESLLGTSSVGSSTNNTTIDAGAITLVQSSFLGSLHTAFSTVATHALRLLYLFAVLELVFFGFVWALQRDVGWDKLFFKIIKIGLIFFIIQNYTWLLDTVMHSFAQLAGIVINNTDVAKYIFNPARIWQYGYNSGVHMLQLATGGSNVGLAMIQVSLGMGILLVFGLIGIQMVIQMISFYLVSLGALILLPFGAFTLGRGMFDKAVQAVLQAGIRLMALITVVGIAVVVWNEFDLAATNFNINQPLGLFFTALLILCLAYYLPRILSDAIGNFSHDLFDSSASSSVVVHESRAPSIVVDTGAASDMRAATAIEGPGSSTASGYVGGGDAGAAAAAPVSVSVAPSGGSLEAKMARETLAQASVLSKSVSEGTVKKIKEAVLQAVKEKK